VNLDALVIDAVELLDEWQRDSTDLVVIVGRDLVHDKYFPMINTAADKAMEIEARDRILRSEKQIGGLPAVRVPFFPARALLITSLDNLAIYEQEETRRRQLKEESEYNRVANYESANVAYVVEDYGKAALVENIVLAPKPA
jgi:P2 family phage major capsid protein